MSSHKNEDNLQMKILLIYISSNRTTDKISNKLQEEFNLDGHQVFLLNIGKPCNRQPEQIDPQLFQNLDLIGIGSPVFHMRLLEPLEKYLKQVLPLLQRPLKAFVYLTYGGITTGKAFLISTELLKQQNISIVGGMKVWGPHFFNHVEYPDVEANKTVELFVSSLKANQYRSLSWPKVIEMFSYQTWRVKAIYPLTHWIGKTRELPIHIDVEKCKKCGRCVIECPTGAMEMKDTVIYNNQKCIYCYHCTTVCKLNAVICPTEKVEEALKVNKKVIGCEKPVNAVYL